MIKYIIFGCIALFVIYEVVKFSVFLRIAIGRYHSKKENLKTKDEKELRYLKMSLENQEWILSQNPEEITIEGYRGCRLKGHFIQAKNQQRVILAFHGWHGDWKRDFSSCAKTLLENECSILLVEQRAHGESGGKHIGFGVLERFDCKKWTEYAYNRFGNDVPVYLYGVSMGASTVLMASSLSLPRNVKGIIADCGFTSPYSMVIRYAEQILKKGEYPDAYIVNLLCKKTAGYEFKEYSTLDALKECKLPVLFIHGKADAFVPYSMTLENYQQCPSRKALFLVEGADHCRSFYINSKEYMRKMASFFSWKLPKTV